MRRPRVSSGTDWEAHVGYSRAVAVDGQFHVAGTTLADVEFAAAVEATAVSADWPGSGLPGVSTLSDVDRNAYFFRFA